MLSVLIQVKAGDEEKLARTLASLVPAAVEGVVRDVTVIDPGREADVAQVADHAGCRSAETLAAGIGSARSEWLLLLEAGARLVDGWSESVLAHAAGERDKPARFSRDASARPSLPRRLFPARANPLSRGLLIRRDQAAAMAGGAAGDFAKRVRPQNLSGRIVPAR